MKMSLWLALTSLIAFNLVAQTNTNSNETGAKPAPAAAAPKKFEASTPLTPGPATVAAKNVNVRGQARLMGEVIGKVTQGDAVNVIEEVLLKKSGPDEPSAWAKISLPQGIPVYVHSMFISNNTVVPARLNLRAGPGENYSVLGRLQRGDFIQELERKGDWIKVQAPDHAFGFVAAQYLRQEPVALPAASSEPVAVAPATNEAMVVENATVAEQPAVAPPPSDTVAAPAADTNAPVAALATTNDLPAVTTEPSIPEEPLPPRIVQREGFVRDTISIQAPTEYGLHSVLNRRLMNYLESPSVELDLSRYKGMRVIITGEEYLDQRWPNTPVIIVQKVLVLE